MMPHLTDTCWFGLHPNCEVPQYCGCLCHVELDEEELETIQ